MCDLLIYFIGLFTPYSTIFHLYDCDQHIWLEETQYHPQIAVKPSRLRQERKPTNAGLELTATALVKNSWVIALRYFRVRFKSENV